MRELARKQGFALGPVQYKNDDMSELADAIINDHAEVWEQFVSPLSQPNMSKLSNFACRLILRYAPFFKAHSFARENEWRLIKVIGIGDASSEFRANELFGLVEYLRFNFKVDDKGKMRRTGSAPTHLIPRITVGPGNESEGWMAQRVPYELLDRQSMETRVSQSDSSLRFVG
jgi:hypothetical protein